MADQSIIRITKELNDLQRNEDLSLAVACQDIDVRAIKAMIIGPHETPYEFGFFEFSISVNKEYPRLSPSVVATTTNGGRTRFNPNIYANGKVCLSILGTWRGERGEEWSAAQGIESILLSIQSLMSTNPYENEPGFENARSAKDKISQAAYVRKIRHETLRLSVIQRLEEYLGIQSLPVNGKRPLAKKNFVDQDGSNSDTSDAADPNVPFEPFKDLCKQRFLWYFDTYKASIETHRIESRDGEHFSRMPFEGSSNSMEGSFNYGNLLTRLLAVKAALDQELVTWAERGEAAAKAELSVASNLVNQHRQITTHFKENDIPHDIQFENNNPFVWFLTYFGRPMTNLDGGLFRIKIHFSPSFPEEQPRVRFETPLFHHRIAADGTLCYFPNPLRREDIKTHIEAIIFALEDESPRYDPRTCVHPEAFKLYWGTPADRKLFNRKLRRGVQDSIEAM